MSVAALGYGLVTPFGFGVQAAVDGVRNGVSCVAHELLDGQLSVMAARVPGVLSPRPAEAILLSAVREALGDVDPKGLPFFVGTCSGEMRAFERWLAGQSLPGDPTRDWYESPARHVAQALGLAAPVVFTSACTSALTALHYAHRAIVRGEISHALVAGVDVTCLFAASGFATLKAANAQVPARPFSRSRAGLSFGEGAAAVLLAREGPARFHLLGTGLSADAKHITAPRADGLGLEQALRHAVQGRPVDCYVAHGTGTVANDAMEIALGTRMGWLGKPWLAHKALIGHAMGASALISLVLANEQIVRGVVAPLPYDDVEDGLVLGGSLAGVRTAVVAAAAFGGSNAAAYWEAA